MLPKLESGLGGAADFMSPHCSSMAEAAGVDPIIQALPQISTFIYKQVK
jgi:hypothetical protein